MSTGKKAPEKKDKKKEYEGRKRRGVGGHRQIQMQNGVHGEVVQHAHVKSELSPAVDSVVETKLRRFDALRGKVSTPNPQPKFRGKNIN